MPIEYLPLAANLTTGLIIAAVTARITVHYSLKRFHSEKWWERKASAYAAIIENLHHVRNHADHHLTFLKRNIDMPETADTLLTDKLSSAMAELRKHWDVGSFVISEEAVGIMTAFMNELDDATKPEDWLSHLILKMDAVDKCLVAMRGAARRDLSLG
jgi:hypothetical protein